MEDYLRTITLGAFTWKDKDRINLFFAHVRNQRAFWLLLHFLLLTLCLSFPVTFAVARLEPFELYNRLYGANFFPALPEAARVFLSEGSTIEDTVIDQGAIDGFNMFMYANGYGRNVVLPLLGLTLGLTFIIQSVFYLCAAFFLGLSRINASPLLFRDRLGLAIYSSTLPGLAATLFGLALPTVHFIVFYFIVIFIIFQRSTSCQNG